MAVDYSSFTMEAVTIKEEYADDICVSNGGYGNRFKEEPELILEYAESDHDSHEDAQIDGKIIEEHLEDKLLVLINEDQVSEFEDDCSRDPLQDPDSSEDVDQKISLVPSQILLKPEIAVDESDKKKYVCEICGYRSKRSERIRVHGRKHSGEKPFSCDICGFRTAEKVNLNRHVRIHSNIKLYSCSLCDYKGNDMSYLKIHMRVHTKEKPYACELCDYRTSIAGHLTSHRRRHSTEKPLKCNQCNYRTSVMGDLNVHLKRHSGEKPFACPICPYRSYLKSALKLHMRKHQGLPEILPVSTRKYLTKFPPEILNSLLNPNGH